VGKNFAYSLRIYGKNAEKGNFAFKTNNGCFAHFEKVNQTAAG
jgi:hypothetical protein